MGMAAPIFYTAEMVRALPEDGNRYETVRGELLVTPAPRIWPPRLPRPSWGLKRVCLVASSCCDQKVRPRPQAKLPELCAPGMRSQ
jgi:hypothetical protein